MPRRSMYAAPRHVAVALVVALLVVGCMSSDTSLEPIFGTQDTVCVSVRYFGEASERLAADSIDCLMDQIEARRPVTIDVAATTSDGSIYRRYAFDGDTTLYVQDSRGDLSGAISGLPPLFANRCRILQRTALLPAASECVAVEHPGFPEAIAD